MFSSHNLDVVKRVCDRVIIIKQGNLIEQLSIEELINNIFFSKYRPPSKKYMYSILIPLFL